MILVLFFSEEDDLSDETQHTIFCELQSTENSTLPLFGKPGIPIRWLFYVSMFPGVFVCIIIHSTKKVSSRLTLFDITR